MKEVIIDGIDISDCKHYGRNNFCYSEETPSFECKNNCDTNKIKKKLTKEIDEILEV